MGEGAVGRVTYIADAGARSFVDLRRLAEGCVVDRSLAAFNRPGPINELMMTRTAPGSEGQALIVTVSPSRLMAHGYGAPEPLYSRELAGGDDVRVGVREGDAYYPIVVRTGPDFVRVTWAEDGPVEERGP